jgi:UDP-3-O-[3-hydroxymyristoyl] N-acetylglucosamine deacetylase
MATKFEEGEGAAVSGRGTENLSPLTAHRSPPQATLAKEFSLAGVGLHSGDRVQVRVLPETVNVGRYFVRVDLPDLPTIPAHIDAVCQTQLSTELAIAGAKVRTVEHLLAALVGMGIDNARIEIDGAEAPLLDGSALDWVQAIAEVGTLEQEAPPPLWSVSEPIWVRDGDAFVAALPSPELRFTYGIDFDLAAIGNQWHSWAPNPNLHQGASPLTNSFIGEIAPARTFGLAHQIEYLQAQGLIKGGSLENALVCSAEGWLNPPLRFPNEPVRHKLLDLIGDLSLVGTIPTAHFVAYKASHSLHTQLARSLNTHRSVCLSA